LITSFHHLRYSITDIIVLPVSFRIPDTRIGLFSLTNPLIQANNFKFSKSILPFFTVLFTCKVQFGGENPILQALGTVFAFCDCVISLLPRILPYSGFTFDTPEYSSYITSTTFDTRQFRAARVFPCRGCVQDRQSRLSTA
jgi:hypothetical protein